MTPDIAMHKSLVDTGCFPRIIKLLENLGEMPRLSVLKILCREYTFTTSMLPELLKVFSYGQHTIEVRGRIGVRFLGAGLALGMGLDFRVGEWLGLGLVSG